MAESTVNLVTGAFRELGGFVRCHWVHFVLLVPGALVITTLHEAGHALAVLVQRGTVTEFAWVPSANEWGHVRYEFAAGVPYSAAFISLAPYFGSLALCIAAGGIALCRRPLGVAAGSAVFFWLFYVPLGDLAYAIIPYVAYGTVNDLAHVFGSPGHLLSILLLSILLVVSACGYWMQTRLCRSRRLTPTAYTLLLACGVTVILAIGMI